MLITAAQRLQPIFQKTHKTDWGSEKPESGYFHWSWSKRLMFSSVSQLTDLATFMTVLVGCIYQLNISSYLILLFWIFLLIFSNASSRPRGNRSITSTQLTHGAMHLWNFASLFCHTGLGLSHQIGSKQKIKRGKIRIFNWATNRTMKPTSELFIHILPHAWNRWEK